MKINGTDYRTIWVRGDGAAVQIIDQTRLPHELVIADLVDVHDFERAIRTMQVRGAPLIGVTAAYGLAMALRAESSDAHLEQACKTLLDRPRQVHGRGALHQFHCDVRDQRQRALTPGNERRQVQRFGR